MKLLLLLVSSGSLAITAQAQSTVLASVSSASVHGNDNSLLAAISADGRHVAFWSTATNLVAGDTNSDRDVFVRDLSSGLTRRVNVDSSGVQSGNAGLAAGPPAISADGRWVAFASGATNLVPGDTNGRIDVFLHDLATGQTTRVSVDSSGAQSNADSDYPAISADGRLVFFHSGASNLVAGDTNGATDVFQHDRQTGLTTRVSVDSAGAQVDFGSAYPAISGDGRFVAFVSSATNLVPGDTNGVPDVFVRDLSTGQTTRVSVDSNGIQSNGYAYSPVSISDDGRRVAFGSDASNLVPGDTNHVQDVFVHDLLTGRTMRASVDSGGAQANDYCFSSSLSGDGRYVAFESPASNLVVGDTNYWDVFVHDLLTGETTRVSVSASGTQANSSSERPTISADGRYVAFHSNASNLVAGDTNGMIADVFVRDRVGSDPTVVSCSGDGSATACPCGNSGSPWHGCENSIGTGGGLLLSSGTASVSADTFELDGSHMPPTASALYFEGTQRVNGGTGSVFGDGLRCVAGTVIRLGMKLSNGGASSFGAPAGDAPISVGGQIPAAGGTFYYQVWYRNTATFCTPSGFNLTNALGVPWSP